MPETLFRFAPSLEFRAADDGKPTLFGHFARFNEWTEIYSIFEGRFMEQIAPGSFKKTFREQRDQIRVLFQHGRDPEVGDKPIAAVRDLREDDKGAFYEAEMFDGLPPLVADGLRAGQYGASFGFQITREEVVDRPERSDHNPDGLPERTVKEVRLREFGPVTFPAYAGATAGVRSLTDHFMLDRLTEDERDRLRALLTSNGPEGTTPPADAVVEAPAADGGTNESSDDEEQAPDRASTPAARLIRVGDLYLPIRA